MDAEVISPLFFPLSLSPHSPFPPHSLRFGPYFVDPVVAGVNKDGKPFICSTDLIGCINYAKDFVVSGTASSKLFGMCESLWEPDLVRFSL